MKKFEIEANNENIKKSIENDLIKRNQYLVKFLEILNNIDGNFIIYLNGKYGTGKTFFIKQLIYIINNKEKLKNSTDIEFKNLSLSYNFMPIYFDALENNENNHVLALVTSIISQYKYLNTSTKTKIISEAKKIVKTIANNEISSKIGIDLEDLEKSLNDDEIIKNKKQKLKDNIDDFISKLAPNSEDKIVIFIDELDKCKPEFVIKMLESVKNFWNNEKIIFVYSLDINELAASVNCIYGSLFDSFEYLQKFYDLIIELPNGDIDNYIKDKMKYYYDETTIDTVTKEMINTFKFTMRDCNIFFQYYGTIKKYECNLIYDYEFDYIRKLREVENEVFLPLLIGIRIKKPKDYFEIINGDGFEKFSNILKQLSETNICLNYIINNGQEDNEQTYKQLEDFYKFFFKANYKVNPLQTYNYNRNSLKIKLDFLNEKFSYNINKIQ